MPCLIYRSPRAFIYAPCERYSSSEQIRGCRVSRLCTGHVCLLKRRCVLFISGGATCGNGSRFRFAFASARESGKRCLAPLSLRSCSATFPPPARRRLLNNNERAHLSSLISRPALLRCAARFRSRNARLLAPSPIPIYAEERRALLLSANEPGALSLRGMSPAPGQTSR